MYIQPIWNTLAISGYLKDTTAEDWLGAVSLRATEGVYADGQGPCQDKVLHDRKVHYLDSIVPGRLSAGRFLSGARWAAVRCIACSQHALACPAATSAGTGTVSAQIRMACGQRGWNRQPGGGVTRLGGAPRPRSDGACARSGSGAALSSSWVYGCSGWSVTVLAGPDSTIRPAYITAIVSARYLADAMSCVT